MTLGPIDDPIERVVTETLSQAVKRQAEEIERLRLELSEARAEIARLRGEAG